MNISYFVDVGEDFIPPVDRQAPRNFLHDKHRVEYCGKGSDRWWPINGAPTWLEGLRYRLVAKPVRIVRYHGVLSTGSVTGAYVNTTSVEGCPFMLEVISEEGRVIDAKLIRKGEK